MHVAERIREGRLDNVIEAEGDDETGRLLGTLEGMQGALRAREEKDADYRGQIGAIGRAQAVIEFDMDGTVREVNDNFVRAMGYARAEVIGKHHSMLVEPVYAASSEYRNFWSKLNRGEGDVGTYKRVAQGRPRSLAAGLVQRAARCQRQAFQGGEVRLRRHRADVAQRGLRRAARGHRPHPGRHRIQHGRHGAQGERQLCARHGIHAGRSDRQASQHVCRRGLRGQRGVPRVLEQAQSRRIRNRQLSPRGQGRTRGVDPGVLQPDSRCQRQALQGGEVRHRSHRHDAGTARIAGRGAPDTGRREIRHRRRPHASDSDGWQERRARGPVPRCEFAARIHQRPDQARQGRDQPGAFGRGGDLQGQYQSLAAHRRAGLEPGGNRLVDGRDDLDGQADRRQRRPGQPARHGRAPAGRKGRRGGELRGGAR